MDQTHWVNLGKASDEDIDILPHWGIVTKRAFGPQLPTRADLIRVEQGLCTACDCADPTAVEDLADSCDCPCHE